MENDNGRFLALVSQLVVEAKLKGKRFDSLDEINTAIQDFVRSPAAVRQAAWGYRPTLYERLNYPLSYWAFRRAKASLSHGALSLKDEQYWTVSLIKSAAHLQFGVPVNAKWYGALIVLSQYNVISQKKLVRLLGASTVFWTKDGELLIEQHHWITRTLIILAVGLILAWGVETTICLFEASKLERWKTAAYAMGFLSLTCVPMLYAAWHIGPFSWKAARRLLSLSEIQKSYRRRH